MKMAKLVSDFNDYLIQRESEKKAITSNRLETSFKYSVVVYLGTKATNYKLLKLFDFMYMLYV